MTFTDQRNYSSAILFLLLLTLSLLASGTRAQAAEAPMEVEGATRVTAEDIFRLFDTLPSLVIIDSRLADGPSSGRAQGYIESSISLPDIQTDCASLKAAITQKDTPTLFYCNGPKCGRSVKAIAVALQCGYNNIYWFRGGFEEWLQKGYPYIKE